MSASSSAPPEFPPAEYLDVLHNNASVRNFLHELYKGTARRWKNKRKNLLESATTEQLDYTMKTLHYIVNGNIPLVMKPHGEKINRSRKMPFIEKTFQSQASLNTLLRGAKVKKVAVLVHVSCYHELFFLLFNKRPK